MENYDSGWVEMEILETLKRSNKPLSTSELSHTTKIPYHRVCVALRALLQKNLLSFSSYLSLSLVPEGGRSGNDHEVEGQSFRERPQLRVKAYKKGGSDLKYYWLVRGEEERLCYIGGGNIKTPLANRYRNAVEAAIKQGEFDGLEKLEIKSLVTRIKAESNVESYQ